MPILVSDANIFIDLEEGGILEKAFELPEQIQVPDLLFHDELAEEHADLLSLGLRLGELSDMGMDRVQKLSSQYTAVSRYDCAALVLASEYGCTLLTGDARLRRAAEAEKVSVHGTIWLVERMLEEGLLRTADARTAFRAMKANGRRLPWAMADQMLGRWARSEG